MKTLVRAAAVLLVIAASAHALAQSSFPSKPLRIIVPFPPGGAVDPLVRALANGLTERIGQSVIVENRPGATGTIGMNACAKSPPDGYTLCFVTSDGMTVIPALGVPLPFDAERDLQPITLLGFAQPVLVASAGSPFVSHLFRARAPKRCCI
jgi:tripartite-type tricarboxylate transporter receptor subunit TctC